MGCTSGASGGGAGKFGTKGGNAAQQKNENNPKIIRAIDGLRENEKQYREAIQTAKDKKVAVIEYENIMGKTDKLWYNGATYSTKKPRDENLIGGTGKYKRTGTYKVKFKAPKEWGKNYDFK